MKPRRKPRRISHVMQATETDFGACPQTVNWRLTRSSIPVVSFASFGNGRSTRRLLDILCQSASAPAGLLRQKEVMPVDFSISILVVDDSATMTRIIHNMLKSLGFEDVDEVHGGHSAFEKMQAKRYALVISDWNMEPMTGYDLLKLVRADPELGQIPFIMVTAESTTHSVIAAKNAGVNSYIVKPFSAKTLHTKIEAAFAEKIESAQVDNAVP
jgi:two-component system chemotaxis response regulator CheY